GHEADASTPSARARQQGYEYCIVSENIAYEYDSEGFTTPALARLFLEGWKRSPEHRRNMLDRGVTETAVAVARSERNGYYYAVQMFGRPKSQSLRFQIRNASRAATRYLIGEQGYWLGPGVTAAHSQCREVSLVYEGAEFPAHDGDRFVVKKEGGRLQLKRE
ncbi:MAG TPA: CAP domain-containing protein, partial [Usitatibacter sp.]